MGSCAWVCVTWQSGCRDAPRLTNDWACHLFPAYLTQTLLNIIACLQTAPRCWPRLATPPLASRPWPSPLLSAQPNWKINRKLGCTCGDCRIAQVRRAPVRVQQHCRCHRRTQQCLPATLAAVAHTCTRCRCLSHRASLHTPPATQLASVSLYSKFLPFMQLVRTFPSLCHRASWHTPPSKWSASGWLRSAASTCTARWMLQCPAW